MPQDEVFTVTWFYQIRRRQRLRSCTWALISTGKKATCSQHTFMIFTPLRWFIVHVDTHAPFAPQFQCYVCGLSCVSPRGGWAALPPRLRGGSGRAGVGEETSKPEAGPTGGASRPTELASGAPSSRNHISEGVGEVINHNNYMKLTYK